MSPNATLCPGRDTLDSVLPSEQRAHENSSKVLKTIVHSTYVLSSKSDLLNPSMQKYLTHIWIYTDAQMLNNDYNELIINTPRRLKCQPSQVGYDPQIINSGLYLKTAKLTTIYFH